MYVTVSKPVIRKVRKTPQGGRSRGVRSSAEEITERTNVNLKQKVQLANLYVDDQETQQEQQLQYFIISHS